MSAHPILVLQMQRMGDLILSFPLMGLLQRTFPGHPLWTVAEPRFFTELHRLAPQTVFFPPEAHSRMAGTDFHSIINLSHRPDAAGIAGALSTQRRFGAYIRNGATYIGGYWALYRASIVHNNRYNLFHWSDLHLLDYSRGVPFLQLPPCRSLGSGERVGIFVGASEAEKRPSPQFFGALAKALLRKGIKPVFLGGPGDASLGEVARRAAGMPGGNMCGRLTLGQLAEVLKGLALCITPDTGPMHLAAWVGTPVLNLSLGTVHAWETGPVNAGHHVLRPRISCAGCWRCTRGERRCHSLFHAGRVALVAETLLRDPTRLGRIHLPGLELCRTERTPEGLYELRDMHDRVPSSRLLLGRFWRQWFLESARPDASHWGSHELAVLAAAMPALAEALHKATLRLGRGMCAHLARISRAHIAEALPDAFWAGLPPLIRPLAGYMHLSLHNAEFRPAAWESAMAQVERLGTLLRDLQTS